MTCVSLMEWNPKASNNNLQWDWENLIMYNNNENPNQRKLDGGVDWEIDGGGDSSIPDLGLASSKSASATSSPPGESKLEKENGEPLLGLKLGKRTYFEDSSAASSSAPVTATASASAASLTRRSKSNLVTIFCQVEGCNLDLSAAKDYHRKHRVCENHSKCPKVVVAGLERRFCQQCSRFHGLLEFDEKKRSCRKRLSDHNARRRKPQGETLRFNPSRLHSSIYGSDERRERMMSYGGWESRNPLFHHERGENGGGYLLWEDTPPSSNFTITRECSSGSQQLLGNQPTIASVTAHLKAKGIVTPEASSTRVTGMEDESAMSRRAGDATQDLQRSHSLLSTNSSWGSCEPPSMMTSLETVHTAGLSQSLSEMTHIGLPPVEPHIRPFNPSHAGYLGDNNPPHLKGPYSAEFF